ncbi:hypothetical protein K440DRAFT_642489 [Wilcoxina mikolae CBS 423.85]|nr:hypothetical protein K440DRAFT_642489 [Wilcoxina mikolae CBS 423.85]
MGGFVCRAFLVFVALGLVDCAPVNGRVESTYVPEPSERGTLELYSHLGACVWTVIHTDVPLHRGSWDIFWYKMAWVVTAILAPELTLFVALTQYYQARDLFQLWCKHYPQDEFSMQGAFFVVMGGFTLHKSPDLHDDSEFTTTLTLEGFKRLAKIQTKQAKLLEEYSVVAGNAKPQSIRRK